MFIKLGIWDKDGRLKQAKTSTIKKKGDSKKTTAKKAAVVKKDDLKKVEGIGPKIESLLNAEGIFTWAKLAKTSVKKIQSILDAAGPRYRMAKPDTWPQQAALAAKGQWDELEKLQDYLDGGKTPK
ncbi:MAG TPA: hypothetical protein ENK85_08850 [Saprospiraceae bacterium]|nr:hypothetical protein [Saprospiraceae bacterium]